MSYSKSIAIALTTFVCATALAVDAGAQGRGGGGHGGGGSAGRAPSGGSRGPSGGQAAPRGGPSAGTAHAGPARGTVTYGRPGTALRATDTARTIRTGAIRITGIAAPTTAATTVTAATIRTTATAIRTTATRDSRSASASAIRTTRYGYYGYPYAYGYPGYAAPAYGAAVVVPQRLGVRRRQHPGRAAQRRGLRRRHYAGVVDDYDGTFQRLDLQPGRTRSKIRTPGQPLVYDVNVGAGQTVTIHATSAVDWIIE